MFQTKLEYDMLKICVSIDKIVQKQTVYFKVFLHV